MVPDMGDDTPIPLNALNMARTLLGNSGRVVTLATIAGRVGYLNKMHHRGAAWVWLTADQLKTIRRYEGPQIPGEEQPHYHLPGF